jgi:hypothetical protein
MIGILLVSVSAYMAAADVYSLCNAKIDLEHLGEDLVGEAIKEISYQEYYFGTSNRATAQGSDDSYDRDFLPISCREVLAKFSQLEANLPRDTKVLSANCAMNQLNLSIMKRVDLPFYPSWLDNFQPNVVAFVGGGLQRIRLN